MKNELDFDRNATADLQTASPFDIKCIIRAMDEVENDILEMKRLYLSYVTDFPLDDDEQINLESFKVGKMLEHIRWLYECVSDLLA